MENSNKKTNKIIIIIPILLLIFFLLFSFTYIYQIKIIQHNNKFNIYINVDEDKILEIMQKKIFILKEKNEEKKYNINELGIEANIKKFDNTHILPYINTKDIKVTYNDLYLKEKITELNKERTKNESASLYIDNGKIIIKEEKRGNYLNIDKLAEAIIENLNNGYNKISLEDYYFEVNSESNISEEIIKEKNKFENFKISYTNGYEISWKDLINYIYIKNNKILFNEELEEECYKYIDKLLERNLLDYDTIGKSWNFITPDNEKITVSGGTYGDYFSSDKEAEYIIEKFKNFESEENREPIKTQDLEDEIPNTYIAVSINDQHMWYYKDGELVLESDIVTGTKGAHDTPKGVYFISEKKDGKYLTGDDYRTWVNRWMRLTNRGHGLHDATWRGKFGGLIYKNNGSHGCINLPKDIAYQLYDLIKLKDCVVIY